MKFFEEKFIDPCDYENVRTFKYVGTDASYWYNYVSNPIAKWIVKHYTPKWVA